MSDDKKSYERDHIRKYDEVEMTEDIEVLKLVKLSPQKNIDNIEKESDEGNQMDMSDDKDYDERYQIDKDDEEIVTHDIEVLKQGKLGSQKSIDNIEK